MYTGSEPNKGFISLVERCHRHLICKNNNITVLKCEVIHRTHASSFSSQVYRSYKISLSIFTAVVEEHDVFFQEEVDEKNNTTSVFIPLIKNNRAAAQRDAQRRPNKL